MSKLPSWLSNIDSHQQKIVNHKIGDLIVVLTTDPNYAILEIILAPSRLLDQPQ